MNVYPRAGQRACRVSMKTNRVLTFEELVFMGLEQAKEPVFPFPPPPIPFPCREDKTYVPPSVGASETGAQVRRLWRRWTGPRGGMDLGQT